MSKEFRFFSGRFPNGDGFSPIEGEEQESFAAHVDEAFTDQRSEAMEAARMDIDKFGNLPLPKRQKERKPRNPWLNRRQRRWAVGLSAGVLALAGATAVGLTSGHEGGSSHQDSGVIWQVEPTSSQVPHGKRPIRGGERGAQSISRATPFPFPR